MSPSANPTLTDQQGFWNGWNAAMRNPNNLNDWCLRRGAAIVGLVRSLAIEQPKILDFGCGTGWLTEWLAEFGDATGIDLADHIIAEAKLRWDRINFIAGDLFQVPLPSAYYDIVVSQEVIAHVPDQVGYLDRVAEVLKPNGYLIITTPNKFVIERADWPPSAPEHIEQWLTRTGFKRLLRPRFSILRSTTILPMGHHGILRLINGYKVNAALGLLLSERVIETLKEQVGLGYTMMVLAQKRKLQSRLT